MTFRCGIPSNQRTCFSRCKSSIKVGLRICHTLLSILFKDDCEILQRLVINKRLRRLLHCRPRKPRVRPRRRLVIDTVGSGDPRNSHTTTAFVHSLSLSTVYVLTGWTSDAMVTPFLHASPHATRFGVVREYQGVVARSPDHHSSTTRKVP